MKEDTIVVKIEFYDPELGTEQVVYGEVKAIKVNRFKTNEDSWITLTDSCRSLNVSKIDVARISESNDGEVIYSKSEEKAVASENASDLVGLSSS